MIYLNYWTPKGHCKRKKFKTVEEARKFGVKLRKKEGYIVMKYGCIHAYKTERRSNDNSSIRFV